MIEPDVNSNETATFFASDKPSGSSAVTVVAKVHRADHDLNLEVLGSTDTYFTDLLIFLMMCFPSTFLTKAYLTSRIALEVR